MINCKTIEEKIQLYIDHELDETELNAIKEHLASCSLCTLLYTQEKQFQELLQNRIVGEKAPYELREKIFAMLEAKQKPKIQFFPWKTALQFAFVMVILGAGLLWLNRNSPVDNSPSVFTASVENHKEYLAGNLPLEFKTQDRKEAIKWFKGKTDLAVMLPHMRLRKINLVGGNLVSLQNKPAAYLQFEKDGYTISTYFIDYTNLTAPQASEKDGIKAIDSHRLVKTENGFSIIFCHHPDGTACIIVTDMPFDKLSEII